MTGTFTRTLSHLVAVSMAIQCGAAGGQEKLQFNRDIRPILSDNCFSCHGPSSASREADLRLDERDSAVELKALVPGDLSASEALSRITSSDPDTVMPPPSTKKKLTPQQIKILQQWVAEGAEYEPHWAFIPIPSQVSPPQIQDQTWGHNAIDAFVLSHLHKHQLAPSQEATREQWLRRVTFDLTGLPPTLAEIDAFLQDRSEKAYETVVDRLLESPAYGERLASDWLDVARYADTFGFQADRETHLWPWRDWVIKAFNENLSYKEFIVWQIAGDMLDKPTREQILATAFNRLHRQTNEGGSIEEEFRIEYIADRVRTMGTAFLGLTLECSRCHDHKYDPISQQEYYQLTAFFNNIDEHGLYSHFTETAPTPALPLYEGDQKAKHDELLEKIRVKESELAKLNEEAASKGEPLKAGLKLEIPQAASEFRFDDLKDSGDYRAVPGRNGQAIEFGGDDAYGCGEAGAFDRTNPFSFSLWVNAKEHHARSLVLHRSRAAEDSAYRGYSLVLDNGYPTFSLVHFWPGNAIQLKAKQAILTNEWVHLAVTYDGSSHASGVRIYVNGQPAECDVVRDVLTRDIIHRQEWGDYDVGDVKLALGARFRDVGFIHAALDDFLVFDRELSSLEVQVLQCQTPAEVLANADNSEITEHVLLTQDEQASQVRQELQQLRQEENALISQVKQIMVMQELPYRRETFLLARGDYTARKEPVFPETPAGIMAMGDRFPHDRLGFAKWLVDDQNPLTARVAVNRFWQLFFGRGIVSSSEDVGSQGTPPTHPELLDWLARDFMDHGWDVKRLCKQIVLSSTYRQSSTPADPAMYTSDPDNQFLARGPRHRFLSEQVRDNALAVSGLLVSKLGGPSVYPYQPAGLWEESGTGKHYAQSKGEGLYRRSMYSFWRRTSPPPVMTTFDAPSREYCIARRERTATPLQSLILLNDPQIIEASRVLAEKLLKSHPDDVTARLVEAFRLLTSRLPHAQEIETLLSVHASQLNHFQDKPEQAKSYVSTGESTRDETVNPVDQAALAAVIQLLMNFDECVTKR